MRKIDWSVIIKGFGCGFMPWVGVGIEALLGVPLSAMHVGEAFALSVTIPVVGFVLNAVVDGLS